MYKEVFSCHLRRWNQTHDRMTSLIAVTANDLMTLAGREDFDSTFFEIRVENVVGVVKFHISVDNGHRSMSFSNLVKNLTLFFKNLGIP